MTTQATQVRSRAVMIVGAGRSGTSALTRGVHALGVELGDNLRAATAKNPTGFFEDRDLLRVAKEVRSRLGLRAESVRLVSEATWRETDFADLRKEVLEIVRKRFGHTTVWGFKYSQTLRYLPFWEDALREAQVDLCFVVALRNPLSVARSRKKLDARRGEQEKSDLEWLVNVVPYFRPMTAHPLVVVDFDLLMADPGAQLRRVRQRLELPGGAAVDAGIREYAGSFLKQDMRHTQFDDDALDHAERLNPLTREAYRALRKLATDEVSPDSGAFWDSWARIETAVAELAPVLAYVDRLDAEVRAARWSPASFLHHLRTRLPRRARR